MHIKGLLEMMFDKLAGWIDEFISDMEVSICIASYIQAPALASRCFLMDSLSSARTAGDLQRVKLHEPQG